MLCFSNWHMVNTFFYCASFDFLIGKTSFIGWRIFLHSLCMRVYIFSQSSCWTLLSKSQGLPSKIWFTFIGWISHYIDSSKSLPKRNVTKQRKLNGGVVNLCYLVWCFFVLRFNFSTNSYMFKLLPLSMIMVHNLPWQEIRAWKRLSLIFFSLHLWDN